MSLSSHITDINTHLSWIHLSRWRPLAKHWALWNWVYSTFLWGFFCSSVKYEILLQTFAQTLLLTHCSTMCHTNILQCWYNCCQKHDMAYRAERRQRIWRDVGLHPLSGESKSIFLSSNKMGPKKMFKCTQHSVLISKNINWLPSTEHSWGFLFPCEISDLLKTAQSMGSD